MTGTPRASVCARALVAALLACAAPASAQTEGVLALGAAVSFRDAPAEGAAAYTRPTFLWRLGQGHTGWGWRWGLNWYSAELREPVGTSVSDFGKLRIRPIMAGYGYQHRLGRTLVGGSVIAGYALASFDLHPVFDDAYRQRLGATTITTETSNTFTLRPEVSVWVDLSRKIGVNIASGYTVARPSVTVVSSLGEDRRRIRADMLQLRIGAVYSVF